MAGWEVSEADGCGIWSKRKARPVKVTLAGELRSALTRLRSGTRSPYTTAKGLVKLNRSFLTTGGTTGQVISIAVLTTLSLTTPNLQRRQMVFEEGLSLLVSMILNLPVNQPQ